jgi:hypothetical protein
MAANTVTYNAIIDVDTRGVQDVDVLNRAVQTSVGNFDTLNQAIGETEDALGKLDPVKDAKKFKVLTKEIKELRDRQEDVEIASRRFTEALAEQPGIIGLVGGSIDGLRSTLKVFMANPIIAVVTAIAGAFLAMRESLTKTSEGQETLNRISAAFGKILGPVFAVIEKVALPIFEKFADLLELVGKGFNRFARFLGIQQEKIEEASRNSSEVLQTAYEEEQTRQEELTKVTEEESQKRIDATQREVDEIARIREQAARIQLEAELSLLSERDRLTKEREMRFQEERKILIQAGYTDLTALEDEFYGDLLAIKRRFDENSVVSTIQTKKREGAEGLKITGLTLREEIKVKKESNDADVQMKLQAEQAKLQVIGDALGAVAQAVGENTVAGKALAIAQATINTYQGATLALATYPPPFGAIAAGVVIAAGLLNVKKIVSQKVPKPPGTNLKGAGGGGGGGAAPIASAPQIQTAAALQQQNTGTQIAQTIADSTSRPIQAYVVSTEVSSTQALDRRTNSAATFG